MRRCRVHDGFVLLFAATAGFSLANGCAATSRNNPSSSSSADSSGAAGAGGHGGADSTTSSVSGSGGTFTFSTSSEGGDDAGADVYVDPCNNQCGPAELCDEAHLGFDDNCNGLVDEECACQTGQAHFCFVGNPAERGAPGCFDGTEICSEQGQFGPCVGGVHAWPPDNCFQNDVSACHAISSPPYATVHLKTGTGNFAANAVPGTEAFAVTCPSGVSQCPVVALPDSFTPLQSGEYTVTYSKMVAGDPNPKTCTFPLVVGAPGLRVELSWEHTVADSGVDLDLHVHQPDNTQPWGVSPGVPQDCTWNNCVESDFWPPDWASPNWFADPPAMPPTPVDWYNDTLNPDNNTCYNDPRGVGEQWKDLGMGCHNPRLDVDNISCDYSITDSTHASFCTPENINIDYPPQGQWIRIGVHYYGNHGLQYDVHPQIKVFCNGALAANLGQAGYYSPEVPVTFEPIDGAGMGGNRFWVVADVAFISDACGRTSCTVKPIYADPVTKTPFFTIDAAAQFAFAPDYPPPP